MLAFTHGNDQDILGYVKFRTDPPCNNSWNLNTNNAVNVNRMLNVKDRYHNNEDASCGL
jgi:hypothetical protein